MNRRVLLTVFVALALGMLGVVPGVRAQTARQSKELPGLDKLPVIRGLPDPLVMNDGRKVTTRSAWFQRRREITDMLLYYEYGHLAPAPPAITSTVQSTKQLEGTGATEKTVLLSLDPDSRLTFRMIMTIPPGKGPFPAIVKGDLCWGRVSPKVIDEAVKRGYIIAEFDRTELAPDSNDRTKGVYTLYPDYDWTVLGAWAWGYQRAVDFLSSLNYVIKSRVAITGHSRGGKAALLAGALDVRIALTVPNGSGCGGAGSYRVLGEKCEDLAAITNRFPYWFQPRLKEFVGHVDQMPFDQHFLRALVAPRPQLSTEALGDLWANPSGTQASYLAARKVYEFLGAGGRIGIHYREGKHEQNETDWQALLDFADQQFFKKKVETKFDSLPFPEALPAKP